MLQMVNLMLILLSFRIDVILFCNLGAARFI
nr:MAG TPA: hypothetical protein [Bacteriophage sp.]